MKKRTEAECEEVKEAKAAKECRSVVKRRTVWILAVLAAVAVGLICYCVAAGGKGKNVISPDDLGTFEGNIVAQVECLKKIENDGEFGVAQGSCTDGTYIYVAMENANVEGGYSNVSHYCEIFKIRLDTLEVVKISEPLLIDHGNDLTYNETTGQIVAVHNAPNRSYLSFIDPETLELIETVKDNVVDMYAIAYESGTERYVVGNSYGYNFSILDSELNLEKTGVGLSTGNVTQGMECDEQFIYFLQYDTNVIMLYDWEGRFLRIIPIDWQEEEPEAIFRIKDQFYLTSKVGNDDGVGIYKLTFVEKEPES